MTCVMPVQIVQTLNQQDWPTFFPPVAIPGQVPGWQGTVAANSSWLLGDKYHTVTANTSLGAYAVPEVAPEEQRRWHIAVHNPFSWIDPARAHPTGKFLLRASCASSGTPPNCTSASPSGVECSGQGRCQRWALH
jgi:hypothetical protein